MIRIDSPTASVEVRADRPLIERDFAATLRVTTSGSIVVSGDQGWDPATLTLTVRIADPNASDAVLAWRELMSIARTATSLQLHDSTVPVAGLASAVSRHRGTYWEVVLRFLPTVLDGARGATRDAALAGIRAAADALAAPIGDEEALTAWFDASWQPGGAWMALRCDDGDLAWLVRTAADTDVVHVWWGDGATSDVPGASGSDVAVTHSYASAGARLVVVLAHLTRFTDDGSDPWRTHTTWLPRSLQRFDGATNGRLAGPTRDLPRDLTHLAAREAAGEDLTGDVRDLPPALVELRLPNASGLSGVLSGLPRGLTALDVGGTLTSGVSGDISGLPAGLAEVRIASGLTTGDIATLPNGLTSVSIAGAVHGDVADLPVGATDVSFRGPNTLTGDVQSMPASLEQIEVWGDNTVWGDIAALPAGVAYASILGASTISCATTSVPTGLANIVLRSLPSATDVDNLLAGVWAARDVAKSVPERRVRVIGGAAPTSAGVATANDLRSYRTPGNDPAYNQWTITVPEILSSQTATYASLQGDILNPERGFHADYQSPSDFSLVRGDGFTLNRWIARLDAFRAAPISQAWLDQHEIDLAAARTAGIKLVLRYAYNYSDDGQDAPLPRILGHIAQLAAIWSEYGDTIAILHAGFIGRWGEWNGSTNGLSGSDPTGRNAVIQALLDNTPESVMLGLRYPEAHTEFLGNSTPINAGDAFTGIPQARLGLLNDSYLANHTDGGTFVINRYTADYRTNQETKAYWRAVSRYTAASGETVDLDWRDGNREACGDAQADMAAYHWDVLNHAYSSRVINGWVSSGCYAEIAQRLGYRLRLVTCEAPSVISAGSVAQLTLTFTNDGWGKVFNPRPIDLILRRESDNAETTIRLTNDARRSLPLGGETRTVTFDVPVPQGQATGAYRMHLALPDPSPNLEGDTRYHLRLANAGTWDAGTGMHDLGITLSVTDGGTPPTDTTPAQFTFQPVTNATPSTEYTSNAVTITGINAPASISTSAGTLVVDGEEFAGSEVTNGQTVAVRLTSSSSDGASTTATVTIGGVTADFTITTATAPTAGSDYWAVQGWDDPGGTIGNNVRWGWEFRTGSEAITVNRLRLYGYSGVTERVILHRVGDAAVIAQADIPGTPGAWVDAAVDEVTLDPNTLYVLSGREVDGWGRIVHVNPTNVRLEPRLTLTRTVYGANSDAPPTQENTYATERHFYIDFGYAGSGAATAWTGITGWDTAGVTLGNANRVGWRFTVGDADLQVNRLRLYGHPDGTPERVVLHRVSDGAAIADEVIDPGAGDAWVEATLDTPITLSAGVAYVVSGRASNGFGRYIYIDATNVQHHAGITFNAYVYGGQNETMPANEFDPPDAEWAEDYTCFDLGYQE